MKKAYVILVQFIAFALFLLSACKKSDTIVISETTAQDINNLKSGMYIHGDITSMSFEMININTDTGTITYSSSPVSSHLICGEYSNSDTNDFTFADDVGKEHSFTVEENAICYDNKSFILMMKMPSTMLTPAANQNKAAADSEYNQFDKCTMEIIYDIITPTGLTVRFTSTNENETDYSSYYRVEKYENEWVEVQQKELQGELCWDDLAYPVPANGYRDCVVDWAWLYGELAPGKYRIIKDIIDFRGTGDFDKYYLSAEFNIE